MQLHFFIPKGLKYSVYLELNNALTLMKHKEYSKAWSYLERAHILAQAWPIQHTLVHWYMLRFGIKIKDRKEIVGQLPRLLIGGVKSFVGNIPLGNTGGTNVPPLQPMQIPDDLQQILNKYQ